MYQKITTKLNKMTQRCSRTTPMTDMPMVACDQLRIWVSKGDMHNLQRSYTSSYSPRACVYELLRLEYNGHELTWLLDHDVHDCRACIQ